VSEDCRAEQRAGMKNSAETGTKRPAGVTEINRSEERSLTLCSHAVIVFLISLHAAMVLMHTAMLLKPTATRPTLYVTQPAAADVNGFSTGKYTVVH